MTEIATPVVPGSISLFDPHSDDDVQAMVHMYWGYLLEGLERSGDFPLGAPVADWLNTFIVRADGAAVAFCSADPERCAIELIYVSPGFRHQGIARRLLTDLSSTCPKAMRIKAPVSPSCQALATQLGIGLSNPSDEEVQQAEQAVRDVRRAINQNCRHKRTGNPQRPCMRCYRTGMKRAAYAAVLPYVALLRGVFPPATS
jgi:GNAT superfamily N-acetyltransferase